MSHVIRISDTTYEKMQLVAVPLEDSADSVLERALDFYISQNATSNDSQAKSISNSQAIVQNPDSPDDLKHTKIRWGRFGDNKVNGRNWSELVRVAHEVAAKRTNSFDSLSRISPFNLVEHELEERGYHFFPNASISVQYRSAPEVWEGCLQIAKSLDLAVEVEFEWLNKHKAAHPGERGKLLWDPAL